MNGNNHHHVAGAVIAAISMAIPESIMAFITKLILGAITGLISGMAYKVGMRLMASRKDRDNG